MILSNIVKTKSNDFQNEIKHFKPLKIDNNIAKSGFKKAENGL